MPLVIPPAGLTPAGLFVPQTFADPTKPPGILAPAIDPQTHEYLSISRGMDPIDSQVLVALTRKRGSGAAVPEDGHTFDEIRKIDDATATLVESKTRASLARLTGNRDISIARLTPVADPDSETGGVDLTFQNLRARDPKARTITVIP